MNIFLLILRILHNIAGVLWVGGAQHFFISIAPTVQAAPESQKFMSAMSLLAVSTARFWTF